MRKATALVSRRLLRDKLPAGRAACGKQTLAVVSQELTVEFGAGSNDTTLTRMARFVERMIDGREVGLAEGQA